MRMFIIRSKFFKIMEMKELYENERVMTVVLVVYKSHKFNKKKLEKMSSIYDSYR